MASALRLALRRVSPGFNAANIDSIVITKYPWFFIAKIKVYPCQIQQGAVLQISNGNMPLLRDSVVKPNAVAGTLPATAV
jgi:hypothetical protein